MVTRRDQNKSQIGQIGVPKDSGLPLVWSSITVGFSAVGLTLGILRAFQIYPFGWQMLQNAYLYLLLAMFLSQVFVFCPVTTGAPRNKVPWYDLILFSLTLASTIILAYYAADILHRGWAFRPPPFIYALALILCLVAFEGVRRTGGMSLFIFCFIVAALPLYTAYMPGILKGNPYGFWPLLAYYAISTDSIIGMAIQTFGDLVIGYIIFGVALVATGGGKFFLDFAFALLGGQQGGPAKVAVVSSALFGTLSGSVVSNVITTGSITIPTMKRIGYPAYYAGAVEAVASTGGCIMPPVMGAVAFVMATFLGVSYFKVVIAAVMPAILYYLALFIQVDGFAKKTGLLGLDRSELPSLRKTLKGGWPYVASFIVLFYFLFMRREDQAPWITTVFLLATAMVRKETRLNLKQFLLLIRDEGRSLAELTGLFAGVGFILGGFSITGLAEALPREILAIAGGNIYLVVIGAAVSCYILGMGMPSVASYIFVAILFVPPMVSAGFDPMAVHLFVLYWVLSSFITPPVALGAYTAASIAQTNPVRVGFQAMRLGLVLYIVPFFFLIEPALIGRGAPLEIFQVFTTCAIGVMLVAGASEGYLIGVGKLSVPFRLLFSVSGILLAMPGLLTDAIGAGIAVLAISLYRMVRKSSAFTGNRDKTN